MAIIASTTGGGGGRLRRIEGSTAVDLGRAFDLTWVDPAYSEAGEKPIAEFERNRRFKHCGGAIAWARRKLFHGEVFGESIEMRTVNLTSFEGTLREEEIDVVDITLAGFRRWRNDQDQWRTGRQSSMSLGKPERKCRSATL